MIEVTIEFRCPECGLMTPGLAGVPAELVDNQEAQFDVNCFHCDEPLKKVMLVGEARALARKKP